MQCEPYFADWSEVGTVHVFGAEIVPDAEYAVQVVDAACAGALDTGLSEGIVFATGAWGDIVAPFASEGGAAQPDFTDIGVLVDAFSGAPTSPIKARSQLQPNIPDPSQPINFSDISAAVDAFIGLPYPFAGPLACP